jgi:hypothetical protein
VFSFLNFDRLTASVAGLRFLFVMTPEQKLEKVNSIMGCADYESGDQCFCMACHGRFEVQNCGVDSDGWGCCPFCEEGFLSIINETAG